MHRYRWPGFAWQLAVVMGRRGAGGVDEIGLCGDFSGLPDLAVLQIPDQLLFYTPRMKIIIHLHRAFLLVDLNSNRIDLF